METLLFLNDTLLLYLLMSMNARSFDTVNIKVMSTPLWAFLNPYAIVLEIISLEIQFLNQKVYILTFLMNFASLSYLCLFIQKLFIEHLV
jgi:hypothetical protein